MRATTFTLLASGKAGHVEDHRAQIGVGAALHELVRLRVVVLVADLEVLAVHRADAAVQLRILDGPVVDLLRRRRVADVVDLHVEVDEAAEIDVRPVAILLDLDVRGFPRARVADDVREHVHLVGAVVLGIGRRQRGARILGGQAGANANRAGMAGQRRIASPRRGYGCARPIEMDVVAQFGVCATTTGVATTEGYRAADEPP